MKQLTEYIIEKDDTDIFKDIKDWYNEWFDENGTETFTKDENGMILINSKTDLILNDEKPVNKQWYLPNENWAFGDVHFTKRSNLTRFFRNRDWIKYPKHLTVSDEILKNNKYPILVDYCYNIEFIEGTILQSFVISTYICEHIIFNKNIKFPEGDNLFIIDCDKADLVFKDDTVNFNNRNNTEIAINCAEIKANNINSSCDLKLLISHYVLEHDAEINVNKKSGNGKLTLVGPVEVSQHTLNLSVNGDFIYKASPNRFVDCFKNLNLKKCNNIDIKNCSCKKYLLPMPKRVNNISLQNIHGYDDFLISFNKNSTKICNSLTIDHVDFENFAGCPEKCKILSISNCEYIRSIKDLPYNIEKLTYDFVYDTWWDGKITQEEIDSHKK